MKYINVINIMLNIQYSRLLHAEWIGFAAAQMCEYPFLTDTVKLSLESL